MGEIRFLNILFIFFLFSFSSTGMLKKTQSPNPANSSSLGKMVWDGFGEL